MALSVRSVSLTTFTVLSVLATAQARNLGPVNLISESRLRAHLEFVAHDLMEGRDTPSRGLDITANYLATQLKLWGAKPGGDNGTFFQSFYLSRQSLDQGETSMQVDGTKLVVGEGFYPRGAASGQVSGQVVEITSGYLNEKLGKDPYAGKDVTGKIVMTDGALPEGVGFRDATPANGWLRPDAAAKAKGAIGLIYVNQRATADGWKRQLSRATQAGQYNMESGTPAAGLPAVEVMPDVAAQIVGLSAGNRAEPGAVSFKVTYKQDRVKTQNVVAIVPGSDPKMANEYVALGAHYDHVGIGRPDAQGDGIYNGADDDGSGTVAILEVAHAMLTGERPKRSAIFVWHAGEEKGLWGSEYFTSHPTVPLKDIVIQVNIDMIGRSRPVGDNTPANARLTGEDEIYLVGPKIVSTDIENMCNQVNNSYLKLKFNAFHDDLDNPSRIYFRSDHANYIAKGVPAVFFFDGEHVDYHRPSDHADRIDYRKMARTTQTIVAVTFAFANDPGRPRINGPILKMPGFGGGGQFN